MSLATPLALPDVLLLAPKRHGDERGFFVETYNRRRWEEAGVVGEFVQDNHSMSAVRGTVRGLHFQAPPRAQAKLVSVAAGAVLDVVVDIRRGSPTYGRHVAVELSAQNGLQLYVPEGFAHGFQTLSERAEVLYKVTDYYAPEAEGGLLWCDPALGVDWPVPPSEATVNARDAAYPTLADLDSPFALERA
jgi:dTDP-4-dehydrorhamnose 3,5-epimerase